VIAEPSSRFKVRFPSVSGIFVFVTASQPVLGPIQFQSSVHGSVCVKVRRPQPEADHLNLVSRKSAWRYTLTPSYVILKLCLNTEQRSEYNLGIETQREVSWLVFSYVTNYL
jgi:hypothetical protein